MITVCPTCNGKKRFPVGNQYFTVPCETCNGYGHVEHTEDGKMYPILMLRAVIVRTDGGDPITS